MLSVYKQHEINLPILWIDDIVFSVEYTAYYYCCKEIMHIVMGDRAFGLFFY